MAFIQQMGAARVAKRPQRSKIIFNGISYPFELKVLLGEGDFVPPLGMDLANGGHVLKGGVCLRT
ncbi:MAG: hypothetical protein ACE5G5_11460 [Candidatus Methylomirabilales bacterium]